MSARPEFIARDVDVVPAASLIAEPTRAAMITALLDDRPLAAGELARLAGVSPATASAHLARLLNGGLVKMIKQGRHRYYHLAGPEVAAAMEALAHLSNATPVQVRSLKESRDAAALAEARTCYDHLAGRAGVALLEALLARGILAPAPDGSQPSNGGPSGAGAPAGNGATAGAGPGYPGRRQGAAPQAQIRPEAFVVTPDGAATLTSFGLNIGALERGRRRFAGACLDWTERKPHLNGALGAAMTTRLLGLGWIERGSRRRAVRVTPAGCEDVVDVAHGAATAELAPGVAAVMEPSRSVVAAAIAGDAPVYGVNTGFGALADTRVGARDLERLQGAIVRSHAAGTGEPLDDAAVRALLLLRARTLAAGYSGVRIDLPARLIEMLNLGLLPVVPGKGSVGASGDLAQLAHLAQTLIGEGRLRGPGDPVQGRPAAGVLAEHGLTPLQLAPKEGLSLVNGTEPMQALLAFSIVDARMLVRAADVACALSIEALLGHARPYDERVQALRPHPGQLDSAANLRALLAGSPLMASHRESRHAVQDAYSLRCAPQVHGAVRDVLAYARGVMEIELGSVVDNPVVARDGEVMISGNFHGQPLAFAADMLAMALAELASISERRVDRMLDPAFSRGLPPFLAPAAGTNSGFMLAQYTAASLVSENKVLAHPASVDTIPTSGKQEDHVSMGWTAARKLREVVANVRACLAVEVLCAAQGLDLRAAGESWRAAPAAPIRAVHAEIRAHVPAMLTDREVAEQISAVDGLLPHLTRTAAAHCGGLR